MTGPRRKDAEAYEPIQEVSGRIPSAWSGNLSASRSPGPSCVVGAAMDDFFMGYASGERAAALRRAGLWFFDA